VGGRVPWEPNVVINERDVIEDALHACLHFEYTTMGYPDAVWCVTCGDLFCTSQRSEHVDTSITYEETLSRLCREIGALSTMDLSRRLPAKFFILVSTLAVSTR
jgi:hypothetical protein